MSTELVPVELVPADLFNSQIAETQSVETPSVFQESAPISNFIPSLSVGHKSSKVCEQNIVKPGEFCLAGATNLSNTVSMVGIDYRAHAQLFNDKQKIEGEVFHLSTDKRSLEDNKEYDAFVKAHGKKQGFGSGMDILAYLPDHQTFVVFFMKGSLNWFSGQLWDTTKGGRMIRVEASEITKGTKTRHNLIVKPTNKAVVGSKIEIPGVTMERTIALPLDKYSKCLTMFRDPMAGVEATATEAVARPGR